MERKLLNFLGGRKKTQIDGVELHLISASALLQAQKEAEDAASEQPQALGLWLNAAILAQAAKKDGKRVFSSAEAVMEALSAERIGFWAERYLALCAEENPPCCADASEKLKQALERAPYERLKWRVLRAFGVLPSEARAKDMTDGDYLYCVAQMMLDEEQTLQGLCPQCREEAMQDKCACCGAALPEENPAFDESRFEELRHGDVR